MAYVVAGAKVRNSKCGLLGVEWLQILVSVTLTLPIRARASSERNTLAIQMLRHDRVQEVESVCLVETQLHRLATR